jgi:hypothetical protein
MVEHATRLVPIGDSTVTYSMLCEMRTAGWDFKFARELKTEYLLVFARTKR